MKEQNLRNIIRESLISALKEQNNEEGVFSAAEEKFLAKFVELGATSLGILYNKNEVGIREFLMRSGKDYNLTPDVLSKLMKDGIISIVPYGGYARNQDYTLKCNLPLDELEGLSSGDAKTGEESEDSAAPAPPPETPEPDLPAGEPQESISSADLSKLLVSEQKIHTKTRVYSGKSRALRRLPKGYIVYLERIIQILGQKLHTDLEKQHLVADILDNLAHNFGLTPKQVYKSFIFYNSQNRLKNIVKEQLENDEDMIKLKKLLKESKRLNLFEQEAINLPPVNFDKTFINNYAEVTAGSWEKLADQLIATLKDYRDNKNYEISKLEIDIQGGSSDVPASNIYTGTDAPNHNFGGLMDTYNLKWVKPGQPGGSNVEPDEKDDEGEIVKKGGTEGNKWLANARAKALQAVLIPYIETALGEKMKSKVVASAEDRKFANAQIRSAVKPVEPETKEINYRIATIGAHTGTFNAFSKKFKFGELRPYNVRLLAKATGKKNRVGTDPNVTFQGEDFGAGPGVSVYVSKDVALKMYQANSPAFNTPSVLNRYIGDVADLETVVWQTVQFLNSPEGQISRNYVGNKKLLEPLNPDMNPQTGKPWQYIDPNTGNLLASVESKRPFKVPPGSAT